MKFTKVILLLFLVAKTGFGMDLMGIMGSDCCSEKTEICETDTKPTKQNDNGCCDGPDCECMCCGQVFLDFGYSQKELQTPTEIHIAEFKYISATSLQNPSNIWHPPKIF